MPSSIVNASLLAFAVCLVAISLQWPAIWPALQARFSSHDASPEFVTVHDPLYLISYRGVSSLGVDVFHNVFYASSTAGVNRFRPPVPLELAANTIVDATAPGAMCPQAKGPAAFPFTSPTANTSENCLSLKISRPSSTTADARLPVVVFLHGGGAILGSGGDQLYDAAGLIRQSSEDGKGIIFVAVNYRLGIFGFATSEALRAETSMNNGLRDQRAAFEWVKANIHSFGGDPERVTAVGQSVGATHIALHMASYAGQHGVPFERAVAMSGGFGQNFDIDGSVVASNTATVAVELGCVRGEAGSVATLDCLRALPMQALEDASINLARKLHPPFGELSFYPQLDGDFLPDRPSKLFEAGSFVQGIPFIGSWSANDGAWYVPSSISGDDAIAASFAAMAPNMQPASLSHLVSLYNPSDFAYLAASYPETTVDYWRAAQLHRDAWFTCPEILLGWALAKHGNSNVRFYEMNATKFAPVTAIMGMQHWGVFHLSDIPFLLDNDIALSEVPLDNGPENKELARRLGRSLVSFAYTDDPRRALDGIQQWPEAFGVNKKEISKAPMPSEIAMLVMGGSHGTGAAQASKKAQHGAGDARSQALQQEKLFERCAFLASVSDEIGV